MIDLRYEIGIQNVDTWLSIALDGLYEPVKNRLRAELREHYDQLVQRHIDASRVDSDVYSLALHELGDPYSARLSFRSKYLSENCQLSLSRDGAFETPPYSLFMHRWWGVCVLQMAIFVGAALVAHDSRIFPIQLVASSVFLMLAIFAKCHAGTPHRGTPGRAFPYVLSIAGLFVLGFQLFEFIALWQSMKWTQTAHSVAGLLLFVEFYCILVATMKFYAHQRMIRRARNSSLLSNQGPKEIT